MHTDNIKHIFCVQHPAIYKEDIDMKLNYLIKKAITDKALRNKLLTEPVQTCKEYAFDADQHAFERFAMHLFKDETILQGGYRP